MRLIIIYTVFLVSCTTTKRQNSTILFSMLKKNVFVKEWDKSSSKYLEGDSCNGKLIKQMINNCKDDLKQQEGENGSRKSILQNLSKLNGEFNTIYIYEISQELNSVYCYNRCFVVVNSDGCNVYTDINPEDKNGWTKKRGVNQKIISDNFNKIQFNCECSVGTYLTNIHFFSVTRINKDGVLSKVIPIVCEDIYNSLIAEIPEIDRSW